MDLAESKQELRNLLKDSVFDEDFGGALLSGGLDTSILTYIASGNKSFETVSVGFKPSKHMDLRYVDLIVNDLDLTNHKVIFDTKEFKRGIRRTIEILETFDPIEIRNSAAIYLALEEAKDQGLDKVITGDGADELFGGYSFLFDLDREEQEKRIRGMMDKMRFSSKILGNDLGVRVSTPYTAPEVMNLAKDLDPRMLIREKDDEIYGKWLLRAAFNDLPGYLVWRDKAPIEKGTGTEIFPEIIEIKEKEFKNHKQEIKEQDNVKIRDKQQLYCYKIYRQKFGSPKTEDPSKRTCPDCNTNVPKEQGFCRTCGTGLETKEK